MAEAGTKWPGPVTFDDEEPKKGFARILLSIPTLKVSKAFFLGKAEPQNATIRENFTKQSVTIRVTVDEGGTSTVYEYAKNLPDIDPVSCTHKVKAGQVIVILCKLEPVSWGGHAKYLIKKE